MTVQDVRQALFALPPQEKQAIFDELEMDLYPPMERDVNDMDDEALETELNRRHEEGLRDPSVWIPGDVVMRELWERCQGWTTNTIALHVSNG